MYHIWTILFNVKISCSFQIIQRSIWEDFAWYPAKHTWKFMGMRFWQKGEPSGSAFYRFSLGQAHFRYIENLSWNGDEEHRRYLPREQLYAGNQSRKPERQERRNRELRVLPFLPTESRATRLLSWCWNPSSRR